MTRAAARLPTTPRRRFRVGTTGWTATDLDDPHIEAKWAQGRYEIVEGVLTRMPAAYCDSRLALKRLIHIVDAAIVKTDPDGEAVPEVDLIVGPMRVPVVDAIYLSPSDRAAQKSAYAKVPNRRPRMKYGRILVPPTLIIESVSPGHEAHDRVTKRAWYAQMKVPHYWLLTAQERSLECLVLDGPDYRADAAGTENDVVRPSLLPGLVIPLATLWAE